MLGIIILLNFCSVIYAGQGKKPHIVWHPGSPSSKKSAGILPYSYDKRGNAYFLIGQERNGTWSDFGGRSEHQDRNTLDTALRESGEETRLVFGKYAHLVFNKNAKKFGTHVRRFDNLGRPTRNIKRYQDAHNRYFAARIKGKIDQRYYTLYLARVDYIPASVFENAARIKGFDKIRYAWVPVKPFIDAVQRASHRNSAYYHNKHIRRYFYDTLKKNTGLILQIVVQ